jgi:hypothetical protein
VPNGSGGQNTKFYFNMLAAGPVLGHPQHGCLYRVYTDASDYAIKTSQQQVQAILVKDLCGTPVYKKLRKAYESGSPVPQLFTRLVKDITEREDTKDKWAENFEDTQVHVEQVIAYWSCTLKLAEHNYSTTEREALGAKEALVKFQLFIEGETVILVTDHSALQWARVYGNTN